MANQIDPLKQFVGTGQTTTAAGTTFAGERDPVTGLRQERFVRRPIKPTQALTERAGTGAQDTGTGVTAPTPDRFERQLGLLGEAPTLEAIQAEKTKGAQAQIDVIREQFNRILAQEREAGVGREARTRAQSIAGGLAGSEFAGAAAQRTEDINKQIIQQREAERAARISEILTGAKAEATETFEARRGEFLRQFEDITEARAAFQEEQQTKAVGRLTDLKANDATLAELRAQDPENINTLIEQSGRSDFEIEQLLKSETNKFENFFRGNNLVQIETDPRTGQVINQKTFSAEDIGLPTNINPEFITNDITGETFFFDKDNPETDEEGKLVLNPVGKFEESIKEKEARELREARAKKVGVGVTPAIKFTSSEKKDIEAFNLGGATPDQQNTFVKVLDKNQKKDFEIQRRKAEQERNISIPPENFLDEFVDSILVEEEKELEGAEKFTARFKSLSDEDFEILVLDRLFDEDTGSFDFSKESNLDKAQAIKEDAKRRGFI